MNELSFFLKFIQEDLKQLQHPSTTEEALHEAIRTLAREAQIAQHQLEEALMSCTVSELKDQVQQRQLAITILADRLQEFISVEDFNNHNPYLPVTFDTVVVTCYRSLERLIIGLANYWNIYFKTGIVLPHFYYAWMFDSLSIERTQIGNMLEQAGVSRELIAIALDPFDKAVAKSRHNEGSQGMIEYYLTLFEEILLEFNHGRKEEVNRQLLELLWKSNHNSEEMFRYCLNTVKEATENLEGSLKLIETKKIIAEISYREQRHKKALCSDRIPLSEMVLRCLEAEVSLLENLKQPAPVNTAGAQLSTKLTMPVLASVFAMLYEQKVIYSERPIELFRWICEHISFQAGSRIGRDYFKICFSTPSPKSVTSAKEILTQMLQKS